jgi:hypothetical protein
MNKLFLTPTNLKKIRLKVISIEKALENSGNLKENIPQFQKLNQYKCILYHNSKIYLRDINQELYEVEIRKGN